jgi:hypothetical protein
LIGYGIPDFYLAHKLLTGNEEDHSQVWVENIFPNPFSSELYIDLFPGKNTEATIRIYSVSGEMLLEKMVYFRPEMKNRISMTKDFVPFASGIYFIQIHSGDFKESFKVNYLRE